MGVARNLEKRLEGMLEGVFTKMFRSGLQPVEVGRRIMREMEEGRTVSVNRIYAPNEFRVSMGAEDFERFSQMEAGLVREFRELTIEQAKNNRWNLMGMPRFAFQEVEGMGKGEFRVEASLAADPDGEAPAVSTREPDAANLSATRAILTDTADRLGLESTEAKLVVLDAAGATEEHISITEVPVTIGRQSTNDVVLSDPNVSRRHAELRRNGDRWVLVDLGSTNGSTVNGKPAREQELDHGDRLSFGTSELVFEIGKAG
ncbi:MAG: FhaA domain-containing protein [Actinomycetota bacterium]